VVAGCGGRVVCGASSKQRMRWVQRVRWTGTGGACEKG
jgi:hypothetical protein